jgi:hypothetical protein
MKLFFGPHPVAPYFLQQKPAGDDWLQQNLEEVGSTGRNLLRVPSLSEGMRSPFTWLQVYQSRNSE